MPIAVLVLTLVAYGYVLLVYPEIRRAALLVGALLAAALAAYFLWATPEAQVAETRIAPEDLTLDHIETERTPRGATVTGRVTNGSERYRLRDMTLVLRLLDCPDPADLPDSCPVIGESTAIARPDVPAGQIRAFTAHFIFSGVPPVVGTFRTELTVTATRGTAG
jgi:hypothetical protein